MACAAGTSSPTAETPDAEVVFNFINPDKPKPFRRRQRSTYVTIIHAARGPDDVLRYEYPLMVRGLANLGMLVVPGDSCHFVTPERGHYSIPDPGDLSSGCASSSTGSRRLRPRGW